MKKHILLRFDDICPTMDREQWSIAEQTLRKYNIKPLLGVIPDCMDPDLKIDSKQTDFWEWLKELQQDGYALAMHGYNHLYRTQTRGMVNEGYKSEFAGLSYEEQYNMIIAGKELLHSHGIDTDIFFAPAHSYDKTTLKALSDAGFRYMSDGRSNKAYCFEQLICLPCKSFGVPRMFFGNYYTAVFHAHEWVRPDKATGKTALIRLCEKYAESEICSFEEYKEQPVGSYPIQRFSEIVNVFYYRYFRPVLSKIKRMTVK